MFPLFKGVSIKVFVIVITLLSLASYGLWKLYTNSLVENGSLQVQNGTLQQNVTHVEQSAKITDSVVNNYVIESKKTQQATLTLRKETINEYVKNIVPAVTPKEPDQKGTVPDGADRVGILADRLHENYCRYRPNETRCSSVEFGQPVHGISPSDKNVTH